MAKSLEDLMAKRPVDRDEIEAIADECGPRFELMSPMNSGRTLRDVIAK